MLFRNKKILLMEKLKKIFGNMKLKTIYKATKGGKVQEWTIEVE